MEFLQFNGQDTNRQAGSAQGYNSLPGAAPLNRTELYQLWVFQNFFDGMASIRIGRLKDSMGVGLSWAWLNRRNFNRSSELMFQAYYQANVCGSFYLEPGITFIPTPGADSSLGGAWASTIQAVILF